ncbi:MAG: hypothetical protein KY455_06200 [Euryarchaeota archaeon]|nr:hypothetical protein [Euryarchaeota archaeon]
MLPGRPTLLALFVTLLVAVPLTSVGAETAPTAPLVSPADASLSPPGVTAPQHVDLPPSGILDAANDDLVFELVEVTSAFGPERYKSNDTFNTRNANDFDNQSANWDAALGHRIDFKVRVSAGEGVTLDCATRFEPVAYIPTESGRLYGWTNGTIRTDPPSPTDVCVNGLPGVRLFHLVFDLDGAPNNAGGEPFPAILFGIPTAVLELYYTESPSANNPTGRGPLAGTFQVNFNVHSPQVLLPGEITMRYPDRVLRMFTDVGPGSEFAMPLKAIRPPANSSDSRTLELRFPANTPAGAGFEITGYYAMRPAPSVQPPVGVPTSPETPLPGVGEKVTRADDRAVDIVPCSFSLGEGEDRVPPSRGVQIGFSGFCRPTDPTYMPHWPVHVVGAHLIANMTDRTTGIGTIVLPISERVFPVRGLDVSSLAGQSATGSTDLVFQDSGQDKSGGPTGTNAGDLHALQVKGSSHEAITKARLSRDAQSQWVRGSVPHVVFPDDVGQYDLLAMLYGPLDEFLGMTNVRRGVDLSADSIRLVEGDAGQIVLRVRSLTSDFDDVPGEPELETTVAIHANGLPGGGNFSRTIKVPEDQSETVPVEVTTNQPGVFTVRFIATSGEITQRMDVLVEVISKEQARGEDRAWYDIPGPSGVLVAVALLGLVVLVRRRP